MMADSSSTDLHLTVGEHQLKSVAKRIREHYRSEFQRDIDENDVVQAVSRLLAAHVDEFTEDLFERLTTPGRPEAHQLRSYLDPSPKAEGSVEAVPVEADAFSGYRQFSFARFAAMTAYIASRGQEIYKTKLNKLLFYSDFINFYLHGNSISGARYVHAPFGPVPDGYESSLKKMADAGQVRIMAAPGFEEITAGETGRTDPLTPAEKASIDWVLANIGWMSTGEISEFSHQEKAYRFTRQGEYIAYDYAKFFRKLPPARS